jgi:hypothetical protein
MSDEDIINEHKEKRMKVSDIMNKYWFFKPDYSLQNNLMAFGFECDEGWYSLIDELCSKLEKLINEKYPKLKKGKYPFEVSQVKEKYGGLRFYINSAPEEILDLIDEYEKKSYKICEICGEPGELKEVNHWYKTVCPKRYQEWLDRSNKKEK